jgi:aspartate kinase
MLVQNNRQAAQKTDLSFVIQKYELKRTKSLLQYRKNELGFRGILCDTDVAKVSVIGV